MAKTKELWGFREVARHLEVSWKTAQKWAREGRLPVLPESEWTTGPVTVYRRHFEKTPLGTRYTHTTEEERVVDKVFAADAIRAVDIEAIRDELVIEYLDQCDVWSVLKRVGTVERACKVLGHGVTPDRLGQWVARSPERVTQFAKLTEGEES